MSQLCRIKWTLKFSIARFNLLRHYFAHGHIMNITTKAYRIHQPNVTVDGYRGIIIGNDSMSVSVYYSDVSLSENC